ncbi:MAG: hypothetical protein AAGC55_22225, partial [Myxococcota bacterium]
MSDQTARPCTDEQTAVACDDWASAAGVRAALDRMFGRGFAQRAAERPDGVVHVTAVWARDHLTLRINAETPRSEWDWFALNAARARADAIITTGKILREEPEVSHAIQGPGRAAEGLTEWRRQVLGKTEPPYLLVLTSGRGLPERGRLADWHPALRGATRPILYTGSAAAHTLVSTAGPRIRVVAAEQPGVRGAI